VRAAIRRADAPNVPDITGFDAIFVDFAKMEVMREDSPVILTATQFKILEFFVQNAERIISRDELLHLLEYNCFSQTIDSHILGCDTNSNQIPPTRCIFGPCVAPVLDSYPEQGLLQRYLSIRSCLLAAFAVTASHVNPG